MLWQSQANHWYIFILNITQGEDDHTEVNLPTPISLTTRSITAYLISYRKTSTPHRYSPFQPPPLTPFLLVFLQANHCNVSILNSIQSKAHSLSLTLGQSKNKNITIYEVHCILTTLIFTFNLVLHHNYIL